MKLIFKNKLRELDLAVMLKMKVYIWTHMCTHRMRPAESV